MRFPKQLLHLFEFALGNLGIGRRFRQTWERMVIRCTRGFAQGTEFRQRRRPRFRAGTAALKPDADL